LDVEELALARLESGNTAIVPGNPGKSELYHRIFSDDPAYQMPPPESNLQITEYQKAVLTRWIEQGANYKPHWSFIPPQQSNPPNVIQPEWPHNPIDYFILNKLEEEGLSPSPKADKTTLLRRVSFDLSGLPPTPQEVDAFLADDSPDSYNKVIDRLLASSAYGERMAVDWMDVARYADSHGYHADGYRMMWPWRDWVIKAFNQNLPFDQFITLQIAGDLLPNPTQEQLLATAFLRNNQTNSEAGIVPEEYRLEGVFDRTNTTAKAFLGLTMECARCHDHKYDPISQKAYYQFSAFFNQVDELGMIGNDGNPAPTMPLMDEKIKAIVSFVRKEISTKEQALEQYIQQAIQQLDATKLTVDPDFDHKGLLGYYTFDQYTDTQTPNLASGGYAVLKGELTHVPGKLGEAIEFDTEYEHVDLDSLANFERLDAFSMGAWVYPHTCEPYRVIMGTAGDKNGHWRGYELYLDSLNRASVRLTHELPDHCIHITTLDSIPLRQWTHVFFTYDGSSKAAGLKLYVNGKEAESTIEDDRLYKTILPMNAKHETIYRPIRLGRSHRFALDLGIFEGAIDEARVYNRVLTALEVGGMLGEKFWENKAYHEVLPDQQQQMIAYHIQNNDTHYQALRHELSALRSKVHHTLDTVPEIMVMRDMDRPRKTFVLDRGQYDSPIEEVNPGLPAGMVSSASSTPSDRLGLARWLVDPQNPLTARVIVNRYWQQLFGRGLVHTLEDFGNQGALPTHPELLDWLATEFIASGWDVKALLRLMVTSATYRQSSVADSVLRVIDPQNELLSRGPSHRLSAEMVRDNALLASGLLVNKVGGPSVKTYQPEGLWSKTHFSRFLVHYEPDKGDKLYRRSLYTFIRRTAPPPTMTVMDASDRSMCIVRRQNTSTPLQALLLLNEPQMLEAARILAERMLKEGGLQLEDQISLGFRLLTSRSPNAKELEILSNLYAEEYDKYTQDQSAAEELLQVGDFPRDPTLPLPEVAALAVVANIMMNFEEVYTKR